jgi:hypothetical protein
MRAPSIAGTRPRRTVSTSGSSGIATASAHGKETGLAGEAANILIIPD